LPPVVVDVSGQLPAPLDSEAIVQLSVPSVTDTLPVGVPAAAPLAATFTAIVYPCPTTVAADRSVVIVVVVLPLVAVRIALPELAECTLVAKKFTEIVRLLADAGVTVAVHVAVPTGFAPCDRLHVPVMVSPLTDEVTVTVPAGVCFGLAAVSFTVTVTVLACPTTTVDGLRSTAVDVGRVFTVIEEPPELPLWLPSPAKEVDTLIVPAEVPVRLAEQLELPPVPITSVQLVLVGATPAPLAVTLTVPVGELMGPVEASLTVTVQLLAWPITTGLAQLTAVELLRRTVIEPLPLLVARVVSPA